MAQMAQNITGPQMAKMARSSAWARGRDHVLPDRLGSGAIGVSVQPEREARDRAHVTDVREHGGRVAGSEGCERQLPEAWST